MSNSLSSSNEISMTDVCFAQKVRHALETEGFFILTGLKFPIETDFVSYVKANFSQTHFSLGGKGGRMCYFSRSDEGTKDMFRFFEQISIDVLGCISPELSDRIKNSEHSCVQLTRYPKTAANESGEILVSDHTDPSFITVITSSSHKGFNVQGHVSGWTEVKLDQDRVAIFVSDSLQKLTGGKYKAVLHKVTNTFEEPERYSCQIFPFAADGYNVRNYHQEGYA